MKILLKIKRLIKNIQDTNSELVNHRKKEDDNYALNMIQSLVIDYPYLPLNGGALRPICIAYILNEIIINNRQTILEFGSGLSTIFIARLMKKNNIDGKIYSIEHDSGWCTFIKDSLRRENLSAYAEIIHADLKMYESPVGPVMWYDNELITNNIQKSSIDLIIVDGPPANTNDKAFSRFPAFIEFDDYVKEDYCIMLDDVNRIGEKKIIEYYLKNNPTLTFEIISETLAVFRSKNGFNPIPIFY